ncbi:MAG: DUF4142 domain-containing protein [Chitinophagaceae bacterium]|nr:MAG: DUF4142 domain-containing protein [Chitinophagaceae bacterium]
MKQLRIFPLALSLATLLFACDKDDDNDDETNDRDRSFAMMAAMNNFAEISAGQMASAKGENAGIRQFGAMMVADHTLASQQLKSIAANEGLYAPDSLDAAHMRLKDTLEDFSGRAFDSVYIHSQVRDHQIAISLFESQINSGQHRDLREFARNTLPKLQMHHHHADSLANFYR